MKSSKVGYQHGSFGWFSDASFANSVNMSTRLGHICVLCDDAENSVSICFRSYNARRVRRSAMAGKVIALSNLADVSITLFFELSTAINRRVNFQLLTDSKSLFDFTSKSPRTSEKRMMLDIAAAREPFKERKIRTLVLFVAQITSPTAFASQ